VQIREIIENIRAEMSNSTSDMLFDAYEVLSKAEIVLRALAHQEDWSFLTARLDPGVKTHTGVRDYPLPDDFGANFVRGADDGSRYVCKLSDGTGEQNLNYKTPAQFFDSDFEAASNGTPVDYTIQPDTSFYKRIWLDPPPDANGSSHYTIRGIYKPSFVNLTLDSWAPEEVSTYLFFGVLTRLDPDNYVQDFAQAGQALILEEARLRNTRLVSQQGALPKQDGWTPEFF